jgi:polysaccharide chain length determinant protein (PEP-CTERM system associated)
MIRNGEISLADAKRLLRRHWWILPISILGCGGLGLLAALLLPKKYTSQTLVLVEQPTVPAEYVKPVVTDDLNHRLASMREQILSRTRLQPIIEKFGLYAQERERTHMEDLIERLRKAVTVDALPSMPGTQNQGLPGFYVHVTLDNAQLAQQVCSEITSMFMEQNSRAREKQATDTTSFLSQQLEEAKAKLDAQDTRLAQFKKQYLGSLPDEEQTNLNLLMGMNSQLEANTQSLSRAHQDKAFNESLLSQQEASWKASKVGRSPDTLDQQLSAMQDQLSTLEARYTPEHPDVIKARKEIEDFRKRIAEAPDANSTGDASSQSVAKEPPQIQQLRAKLRQDNLSIEELTVRQNQIQNQIRVLQGRVQASPVVEQEFKELTRNYQTALEGYNELLKKRDQSAMAGALEHQQQSEQFRILDPPSLPEEPSFPNKAYFCGGGLGAGLILALGIIYLVGANDTSMRTERDIEVCLKLPVLALVPTVKMTVARAKEAVRAASSHP